VTSDGNGRPMNVQVVTLLVTPEQSEALALAQVDGRLQLALRNPLDQAEKKPNAVRREHLFQGGTVAPAPPPPTVKPVNRVVPKKVDPPVVVAPPVPPAPPVVAPPPPPRRQPVQVIQGNKIENLMFEKKDEAPPAP